MFADTLMHLAVCAANSKNLVFEKVSEGFLLYKLVLISVFSVR